MEEKLNPWKANLTNGLILGLIGIVYSLIIYFLGMTTNRSQSWIILLIQIAVMYFLLKSYRDNVLHGQITYGQAVGAGVIMYLYSAIIGAIFGYILYTIIDPGLAAKQLALAEEGMRAKGNLSEAQIDAGMKFTEKLMKPGIMVITGTLFSLFFGTIISLILGVFIKREGNPLVDSPSN